MKAIKQVDVVISTVGHMQLGDQGKIIAAIKEAGNVKVVGHNNLCCNMISCCLERSGNFLLSGLIS